MAIERRDPVPPGRYWVFLKPGEIPAWQSWSREHGVLTRLTERMGDEGHHVVFDVVRPTPWIGFGLPTIAEPGSLPTTQQIIQAPAPEPGLAERLERGFSGAASDAKNLVFAGVLGWIIWNVLKRR